MKTYFDVVNQAKDLLREAGITEYDVDAKWLLLELFQMSRLQYLLKQKEMMPENEQQRYMEAIGRRANREPLQYIVGYAYFMGYQFITGPGVLVPRHDTECLVEEVEKILETMDRKNNLHILDMCTGSGCIALSLALRNEKIDGVGVDISGEALVIANANKDALQCHRIDFVQSDLFRNVQGKFDLIVSNPPYIRTKVIEGLMSEVRDYEPLGALDGHEDGLYFYDQITKNAGSYLADGGYLCYEIGHDQGPDVFRLMEQNGFDNCRIIKDLAGLDRVVIGKKK